MQKLLEVVSKPRFGRLRGKDLLSERGGDERHSLGVLRSGARWRAMSDRYPAYVTCWRRLGEWERADLWLSVWRAFLNDLDEAQQLDWYEAFMDGTFAPAKTGALASEKHACLGSRPSG